MIEKKKIDYKSRILESREVEKYEEINGGREPVMGKGITVSSFNFIQSKRVSSNWGSPRLFTTRH